MASTAATGEPRSGAIGPGLKTGVLEPVLEHEVPLEPPHAFGDPRHEAMRQRDDDGQERDEDPCVDQRPSRACAAATPGARDDQDQSCQRIDEHPGSTNPGQHARPAGPGQVEEPVRYLLIELRIGRQA